MDVSTLLPSHSGKLLEVKPSEHTRTIKDLKGQHLETNLIVVSLMALVSKCSWSSYKVEWCLPLSLANSQVLKSR